MFRRLYSYFEIFGLINKKHFGFRNNPSTLDTLAQLTKKLSLDNDVPVNCIVFLDFKKAVDFFDHQLLLRKLECYGVTGASYSLLLSYLCERYKTVFVYGTLSQFSRVDYGMQQGSSLGSLLFMFNNNDLHSVVEKSDFFLFADNTNVVCQDISIDVLHVLHLSAI